MTRKLVRLTVFMLLFLAALVPSTAGAAIGPNPAPIWGIKHT